MPKLKGRNTGTGTWKVEDIKEALQKLLSKEMSVREAVQSFSMLFRID
jgi:hypothetical protein